MNEVEHERLVNLKREADELWGLIDGEDLGKDNDKEDCLHADAIDDIVVTESPGTWIPK